MSSRRLPPLSMLRAFEAAARHLSFSAAADELGVTHSAISHQVKGLEAWFGRPLFTRSTRKITLTPEGAILLGPTTRALDGMADAVANVAKQDADRPILVSVEPAFAARWLVFRLERFYKRHPDVRLHLVPTPEMVSFERGGPDLAIRYGRGGWPGLASEKILGASAYPVVSPDLVARSYPLNHPGDLAHYTLIHEDTTEDWKAWLGQAGVPEVSADRGPIFDDAHLTLEAAASGLGVALADDALAAAALADGDLIRPFNLSLDISTAYYVVYPKDRTLRPDADAFRLWLQDEAKATTA